MLRFGFNVLFSLQKISILSQLFTAGKAICFCRKAIELQQADGIFAGPGVHHFQGSRRASSPFSKYHCKP
jgi:hypothetical protein